LKPPAPGGFLLRPCEKSFPIFNSLRASLCAIHMATRYNVLTQIFLISIVFIHFKTVDRANNQIGSGGSSRGNQGGSKSNRGLASASEETKKEVSKKCGEALKRGRGSDSDGCGR